MGEGSDYRSPNYKFHSEQGYDEWIYMDRIVVDEDYQSMSIGSKLYTYLIEKLTKEKFKFLCAEVNTDNEGSWRFHQRFGFKIKEKGMDLVTGHESNFLVKELVPGALKSL